jgi:hypothetical protein
MQQLRYTLRGSIFSWGSGSLNRASVPSFHVHVFHVPRTGCDDADYVVNRQCKPYNIRSAILWRTMD